MTHVIDTGAVHGDADLLAPAKIQLAKEKTSFLFCLQTNHLRGRFGSLSMAAR